VQSWYTFPQGEVRKGPCRPCDLWIPT